MKRKFLGAVKGFFILLNKWVLWLQRLNKRHCVALAAAALLVLAVGAMLILRFSPYPELEAFKARPNSVRYFDRNGILLQVTPLAEGLRRERAETIPREIKDVFIFAEDRRFYRHIGVDGLAMLRAFYQNIRGGRMVSGASTITMQLARLISLEAEAAQRSERKIRRRPGQGIIRKIGEIFNALRLEARLSKDEILELYLNSLPFGFNTEGVASAARTFFSSELSMLSPAQVFCLAIIPRRPSLYNPLNNPQINLAAAMELQARFSANKKLASAWPLYANISQAAWEFAATSGQRFVYPFELPHLIRHINAGLPRGPARPNEIHLSIDLSLQRYLERAIAGTVARYAYSRVTSGAGLVIDNETGEILAWVGSEDFHNVEAAGQIDGVLALNQPGSALKPFLFAMALEWGFLPNDVLADIPMIFGEREVYLPRNFNNRFNGPILFRAALASSLNIPSVYLLYRLGVQNFTNQLLELGFDSIEHSAETAGLGLALGNTPVSLKELVRAFSVFPRDGVYIPLTWEMAQFSQGTVLAQENLEFPDQWPAFGEQVFSPDTSRIICSILSDPDARVLAFGAARNFRAPFPVIFKTGTANQFQSIVALGASKRYTAGVWMGNFTGETVIGRTGSSVPAAIARDALVYLHGSHSRGGPAFLAPQQWEPRRICALSGMSPTEACLSIISEYIFPGREGSPCTWHQIINGQIKIIYPAEYQAWFNAAARQGFLDHSSRVLEIVRPRDGFAFFYNPGIGRGEIPVEVIGGSEDELLVSFNNRTFTVERPFVFFLERIPGQHTLHVQSGAESAEIKFSVE
ncbi:MAG: transglycosylase domain-containing protein [Spirochaetes bacterium]|nr:transglycosylase domain-containing protein [Spirochaetota bacterium]